MMDCDELDALLGLSGDFLGLGNELPDMANPGVGDSPMEVSHVQTGRVSVDAPTKKGGGGKVKTGRDRAPYYRSYRQKKKARSSSLVSSLQEDIVALKRSNDVLQAEKEILEFQLEEWKIKEKREKAQKRLDTLRN
eukprot:sb/3474667/